MKRQEIFEKVQAIVAEELKIAQKEVDWDFPLLDEIRPPYTGTSYKSIWEFSMTPYSSGEENMGLVMSLEEEFDLEISDEDVDKLLTVQHAVDYLEAVCKEI